MWTAVCHVLASLVYTKVYFNWKHKCQAELQAASVTT